MSVLALHREPIAPISNARSAASGAVSTTARLTVSIVRTRAEFDALEAEWTTLFERAALSPHLFLTFNWLWHWAEHFLTPNDALRIVTARRHGRLVAILPLVIVRTSGVRVLTAMGDPVSQYVDALVAPEENAAAVLTAAFDALEADGGFDIVRLPKVRADAHLDPVLRARGFRIVSSEVAPYATLAGHATFEAFEARISPKQRRNRRRQARRLEERGPIEIERLSGSPAAADAVRLTMALKRDWLQRRGLFSRAFGDPRFEAFFAAAAASVERPAGITVSALHSNGAAADVTITVTAQRRLGLHILAYDPAVQNLGAGNHHLELALRDAFESGLEVFDFLAPLHPYKMEWADGVVAVNDWARAPTWRGALYLHVYIAGVREGAKWLLATLPKPVARQLARLTGGKASDATS